MEPTDCSGTKPFSSVHTCTVFILLLMNQTHKKKRRITTSTSTSTEYTQVQLSTSRNNKSVSLQSMVQRKRRPRVPNDGVTPTSSQQTGGGNVGSGASGGGVGSTSNTATNKKPSNSASLAACLTLAQTRPSRNTSYTAAGVAGVLYGDLISWAIRQVVIKYKHRTTVARSRAKIVPPIPSNHTSGISSTNYPDLHYSEKNVHATCSNCEATVSASRYAQHLEKCLGRGGRVSSRAASARLKASAERAEREDSEDAAAITTYGHRRRRTAQHDAETGQKGSTKRRRASPAPISTTLPPTGRNR